MGVNIVKFYGTTIIDLTGATVTPETLAEGIKAYDAKGNLITGTAKITPAGPSYDNLFNASDPDFKTNSRISDSSGIGSQSGSHVTGFIQAASGDVIRVRFPNGTKLDSYTRPLISMHGSDKAVVPIATYYKTQTANITLDADGLGYTANIGKSGTAWVRCAINGSYTGAIVTKNQEITD